MVTTERESEVTQDPRTVLESRDAATGEPLERVPVTPPQAVEPVAREVAKAQPAWAAKSPRERGAVMRRAAEILLERADELAVAITRETGKTLMEASTVDVGGSSMVLDWIGGYGPEHLAPEQLPTPQLLLRHKRQTIHFAPLGVVGVISAWNYPLLVPIGPVAMALLAGNGVVFKPSEHTPISGERFAAVFHEAGVPEDVLRVVQGGPEVGAALIAAPSIAKICFTGGVENGARVKQLSATHGKDVVLELGGNDAAIVCADADLDRAVAGTLWAGVTGAGQTCAAVERVYVDRRIYESYLDRLVGAAAAIRLGHPMDRATQLGPLISETQYRRVVDHIDDAVANGARVVCGGPTQVDGLSGRFIAPTILTGVDHSMRVMRDETFGPLIPVMPFDSEEEAIALANDSRYGLGASVWTRDMGRGRRIAERIQTGMVWINDHGSSAGTAQAPWVGTKASGAGVVHSRFGIYEMVEKRLISEDRGLLPVPWWYPYDDSGRRGFIALLQAVQAPSLTGKLSTAWRRRVTLRRFVRKLIRDSTAAARR